MLKKECDFVQLTTRYSRIANWPSVLPDGQTLVIVSFGLLRSVCSKRPSIALGAPDTIAQYTFVTVWLRNCSLNLDAHLLVLAKGTAPVTGASSRLTTPR